MTQKERENFDILIKYNRGQFNIVKKFICFLQKHHALESFIKYRQIRLEGLHYKSPTFKLPFPEKISDELYKVTIAPSFIEMAFGWRITEEGSAYWYKLSLEWQHVLRYMK